MQLNPCFLCGGTAWFVLENSAGFVDIRGRVQAFCSNHSCSSSSLEGSKLKHQNHEEAAKAWNESNPVKEPGKPCPTCNGHDGYHSFDELYHHRAVLFSVICSQFPRMAWKSKLHADGTMFEGFFIVGIETPDGSATYHYAVDSYWEIFGVREIGSAPPFDGHTADDAIRRIGTLRTLTGEQRADLERRAESYGNLSCEDD